MYEINKKATGCSVRGYSFNVGNYICVGTDVKNH
jgi:hypothetical protein